jgi:hypothetical protein
LTPTIFADRSEVSEIADPIESRAAENGEEISRPPSVEPTHVREVPPRPGTDGPHSKHPLQ